METDLASSGRSFQTRGPLTLKARSPPVFKLDLGITDRRLPEGLRLRLGLYGVSKSVI